MVDSNNLPMINALFDEYQNIANAIVILDHDGKIMRMTVAGPGVATVDTSYMDYPQQMVTGIKQYFAQRQEQIRDELEEAGLTVVPPDNPDIPEPLDPATAALAARDSHARHRTPTPPPPPTRRGRR